MPGKGVGVSVGFFTENPPPDRLQSSVYAVQDITRTSKHAEALTGALGFLP